MAKRKKIVRKKRPVVTDELLDALTDAFQKRRAERKEKLVGVGVVFPSGGKQYTYLAPRDHGLKVDDKVITPTGPAHVTSLSPVLVNYIEYKKLVAKYEEIRIDFEYD